MLSLKLAAAVAAATFAVGGTIAVRSAGSTAPARQLVVVARDFAFEMPDTLVAGPTEIRLQNRGAEAHHIWLIRLDEGKSLQDVFAALKAYKPGTGFPRLGQDVGGPNSPAPGQDAVASLDLKPGRYAVLCLIPSADGMPHVMKGMAKEVTVVPAKGAAAPAAIPATVTMTLTDYDFVLSGPLTAGTHQVRVRAAAAQPHEVLVVKLAPGKTPMDAVQWFEKPEGPPPAMPLGGTTGLAQGEENVIALTLEPGEYGLICFLPDAKDGRPHFMHGMIKQFSVK